MCIVTVVDYGVGNLASVRRALEYCGATVNVTNNPQSVADAEKLILPGVGAFGKAMKSLRVSGMLDAIKESVERGAWLIGVCLGMQLLFDESEEFGLNAGIGLISGRVVAIPERMENGGKRKVPHIGWNDLLPGRSPSNWDNSVLRSVLQQESAYFVHSFMATSFDERYLLAFCDHCGCAIPAAVQRERVVGLQFHPEKSGDVGLRILKELVTV